MAPDPSSTDNPQAEPERPAWLPDNFESPEAFADSYKEAQRKITEESTARKALEQNYAELASQVEALTTQSREPQVDPASAWQQWNDAYENDPVATMAQLAERIYDQKHQSAPPPQQQQADPALVAMYVNQTLGHKYDDYEGYRERALELVKSENWLPDDRAFNPSFVAQQVERAYKVVKAEDITSGTAPAVSPQDLARTMKINAQTASGAEGRPAAPDSAQEAWARIAAAGDKPYWG